jgi:hypothetical protein
MLEPRRELPAGRTGRIARERRRQLWARCWRRHQFEPPRRLWNAPAETGTRSTGIRVPRSCAWLRRSSAQGQEMAHSDVGGNNLRRQLPAVITMSMAYCAWPTVHGIVQSHLLSLESKDSLGDRPRIRLAQATAQQAPLRCSPISCSVDLRRGVKQH